jgi:hypothetical protein
MEKAFSADAREMVRTIDSLNETGRQIALKQVKVLQTIYPREPEDPESLTWTGSFRAVRREGNIIYPEWG